MKTTSPVVLILTLVAVSAFGWGDQGHQTTGAIAEKLIQGTPAEAHVRALLGDETLATASLWADVIKARTNQWPEAVAFRSANTNHAAFHYTDIPFEEGKYRNDSVGARPDDVVHAISACILILQGKPEAQTVFKDVSPKTALRLLAHYIGDIHQPLHAGSGYLTGTNYVDPNGYSQPYGEDQGANRLVWGANSYGWRTNNLHFYWDITVVQAAMMKDGAKTPQDFAAILLARPAPAWQTDGPLSDWATHWADESIALSAKVHDVPRLDEDDSQTDRYTGKARPAWRLADLTPDYSTWAESTAETQITKAGYRIAETLKRIWPE